MKPAVLLVDGDMFLHRSLHIKSLYNFTNSAGERTGILYGVLNSLFKLLDTFQGYEVTNICFLLTTGKSFRLSIDENYKFKSQKDQTTWTEILPELGMSRGEYYKRQKELVKTILPTFGIKVFWRPSFEADDIAAFLSKLDFQGKRKILISDDYDWCHLVSSEIDLFRFTKEDFITIENFEEILGIKSPELHCLYLSIIGGHDNIPGVLRGFGEVSARKMVNSLKDSTLPSILEWAEQQSGKARGFLEEEVHKRLEMNMKLVNLHGVQFDTEFRRDIKSKLVEKYTYNTEEMMKTIRKYDFNSFVKIIDNAKLFPLFS